MRPYKPLYGHTSKHGSKEKMEFLTQKLEQHHNKADHNLILGDFNFVENYVDRTCETKIGMN